MRSWNCANCYLALEGEVATSCPGCGGTEIVPADSPRGEQIRATLAQRNAGGETPAKRRGLPPGVGLLVVLAIFVFIGGFLHVVSTTDGLRMCSKENWALSGTFVDAEDFVGKPVITLLDRASTVRALVRCEILSLPESWKRDR